MRAADHAQISQALHELFVQIAGGAGPLASELQRGSALAVAGLLDAPRTLFHASPKDQPCA